MNNQKTILPYANKLLPKGETLVFAPHPDDEIFGCGGAIFRHLQQNDKVKVVIVTNGGLPVHESQKTTDYTKIRRQESLAAAQILGYGEPQFLDYPDGFLVADEKLVTHLSEIIEQVQPQLIYLPAETEIHPDHLALHNAGLKAAIFYKPEVNLCFYEVGQPLKPNFFHDITDIQPVLEKAMDCFKSQLEAQDYKKQITALHTYRSYTLGKAVKFAEAYQIINSQSLKPEDIKWGKDFKRFQLPKPVNISSEEFPLISVIVRSINRPELPEALESIANQAYPNLEVIVVEAKGDSALRLGNWCGKFPIRLVGKNRPLNRPEAANAGLEAVEGDYFCFLDEDDLLMPEHLEGLIALLRNSNAPAAYSGITKINQANQETVEFNKEFNLNTLQYHNYIPVHGLLFNSAILQNDLMFDESLEIYEDWDFILQVARYGDFLHSPKITGIYRENNQSGCWHYTEKVIHHRSKVITKWAKLLFADDPSGFIEVLYQTQFEIKNDPKSTYNQKENAGVTQKEQEKQTTKPIFLLSGALSQMNKLISLFSMKGLKSRNSTFEINEKIKRSGLFDASYYLKNNPDVKKSSANAIKHFHLYGWKEGRNPSGLFDTNFYLGRYNDVKQAGINPLVHFIDHGRSEGRSIKETNRKRQSIPYTRASIEQQNRKQNNSEDLGNADSTSILFIGHDANIAGGQILLLSLIKWFSKNTGFKIKIILIEDGTLADKYSSIAPTLIWDQLTNIYPIKAYRRDFIRLFAGQVDLIYGNTVLASAIYDELSFLNVPIITHVHELEKIIQILAVKLPLENLWRHTDFFIAASLPVAENMHLNHGIGNDKMAIVNDFIEIRDLDLNTSKREFRKKLGLPPDGIMIIGAGTINYRKGVDLFIETALILKKRGFSNFHFYWIGDNFWDQDLAFQNICTWHDLEKKIADNSLQCHINFLVVRENFFEYFQAADVFYLSSREDAFPLVCLEAAQCSVPIICFEDVGGMSEFVDKDAGFVVPYEDVNVAADKIVFCNSYPKTTSELGAKAREKFLSNYTTDLVAPKILNICQEVRKLKPLVSEIIPKAENG